MKKMFTFYHLTKGRTQSISFSATSDSFPSWHMVEILTIKQLLCNVQLIQRGDLLKVPPAAKVPADGIAVCGASPVNKSMITGESSPAANKMGDSVIDGTLKCEWSHAHTGHEGWK